MKKFTAVCFVLFAAAAGGIFAGGKGASQGYTLNMSTSQNESAPIAAGFRDWAEAVKRRTNGDLVIQIHYASALGIDEDVIEQALVGGNVAVVTDAARMANYVRDIGIVGMPYIANDFDELQRIIATPTFQSWDAEMIRQGIRILSYNWYDGPRNFWTNAEVTTPGDLNGLRIRTPGAPVWARSVNALGATPVATAWVDTYNALQTKAIDGFEAQSSAVFPSRIFEVAKIAARTQHFQHAQFIMAGERWFQTLPADYQKILMEECQRIGIINARHVIAETEGFERLMVENYGVKINEVNRDLFIAASERAYDELGFREARDRLWREIGR